MSYKFTLQSLVEKTRRAEQRAAKNRRRRATRREKHRTNATIKQLHQNLANLSYLPQIFPLSGTPTVEHCGHKLTLVTQAVTNSMAEETLTTQLEQYTDDPYIYLRLTHEPSAHFTCLKLGPYQRVDHALHQISSETNQLLAVVQQWRLQQESSLHLAEQILARLRDWYQLYTAWDNECIRQAQALIEEHWTPHMLYRLSYVSNPNPTQPETASLGGATHNSIESIVTCTEPSGGRISYVTIDKYGDHGLQIILGGLLSYEPLIFHKPPQINQPLPYHVCHTIGQHTVCLPPCEIDSHQLPQRPAEPPELSEFLFENGIESHIAGTLQIYLDEEIDYDSAVQTMIKLTPEEFVLLNPHSIF